MKLSNTDLVTVSEAARELGTTRQNLHARLNARTKKTPRVKVWGRSVKLYSMRELEDWWARR